MARTTAQQKATVQLVAQNKARKAERDRKDKKVLHLIKTDADINRYLKRHYPYGAPQQVVTRLEKQQKHYLKSRYR